MYRPASLTLLLLASTLLAPPLDAGSVTGTVTFDGAVPKLRPLSMDADPACAAKHRGEVPSDVLVLGDGKTLGNVFVQLKGVPGGRSAAPPEPVVIDQVGCLYRPRVAGVLVGQRVLFKNSDGLMHNVRVLPQQNDELNIAMPPVLKEVARTFDRPEPLFPVRCDIHPWMRAYIAVMTHPYFAVTAKDGRFEIEDVPAGEYELEVWHEKLGTKTKRVAVPASGAARIDFTLEVPPR